MSTLRLLVVDDEEGMRTGVERALRSFRLRIPELADEVSLEVETAETGEVALERFRARPPDLLLLDHKLPGISGLEVLEQIAAQESGTLTIMITAYASLETAVLAIKQGAYDFLAKPFTPDELRTTVRKAAESLVLAREARRLAQEKRRVRFEFISVLAHELKAPLAAIEGYLQILQRRTLGDQLGPYLPMLERCLARSEFMRKMIGDLLDMTHIESGQKERELQTCEVVEIAQAARESALPEAARRGITITIQAPSPVPMRADRGELEIILNNLISNAVKYNRDQGRVEVSVQRAGSAVVLAVSDTGIGMAPEDAARLFGEFVRIKNDQTRHILGSGLGLSIVKKLALLYEGDVSVQSQPGVGSTFTVRLSASPGSAAQPEALPS